MDVDDIDDDSSQDDGDKNVLNDHWEDNINSNTDDNDENDFPLDINVWNDHNYFLLKT